MRRGWVGVPALALLLCVSVGLAHGESTVSVLQHITYAKAVGQAAAATRGAASSMMHRGEVLPHHQGVGRRLLFNRGSRVDHTIRRLDTSNAFWVFGSQGMQVFDVASGQQLYAVSKDSLCERYERCPKGVQPGGSGCAWTNDCKWGDVKTDGSKYVLATNVNDDTLVVFDMKAGILVASVKTCGFPYYVDIADWREEAYVHCWYPDSDDVGVVDVLSTSAWALNHPLVSASFNPQGQGHGNIFVDIAVPNFGYSTNLADTGLHKLNLNDRSKMSFLNLTSVGCRGAGGFAISPLSMHGYLQCYRTNFTSSFLVEIDLVTDTVLHVHNEVSGVPQVTPDGRMVAVLNTRTGRIQTLRVGNAAEHADDAAIADIDPGFSARGLSRMVFVEDSTTRMAVLTSVVDNFIVLLHLDTLTTTKVDMPVPPDGNSSSLVGHGASRDVAVGVGSDGKVHALITAQRMQWAHIMNLGTSGASNAATRGFLTSTIEKLDVNRVVFVPKTDSISDVALRAAGEQPTVFYVDNSSRGIAIAALVLAVLAVCMSAVLAVQRIMVKRGCGAAEPCVPMGGMKGDGNGYAASLMETSAKV